MRPANAPLLLAILCISCVAPAPPVAKTAASEDGEDAHLPRAFKKKELTKTPWKPIPAWLGRSGGGAITEQRFALLAANKAVVRHGLGIYGRHCRSCHGSVGQGLIGPNLRDDYQIYGASRLDIFRVIRDGILGKGMLPWAKTLGMTRLRAVTTFTISLRTRRRPWGRAKKGGIHRLAKPLVRGSRAQAPRGRKVPPFIAPY